MIVPKTGAKERMKFKKGTYQLMRTRKVSNMFYLANQQNEKLNNGERKDEATLELTWKILIEQQETVHIF
jgi:hypothetical protein